MNTPYVKQYGPSGELLNPIKGLYKQENGNRRGRRAFYRDWSKKNGKINPTFTKRLKDIFDMRALEQHLTKNPQLLKGDIHIHPRRLRVKN